MTGIPELRAALRDREVNAPDGAAVLAADRSLIVSPGSVRQERHRSNVAAGARLRIRRRTVWPLLAAVVVVALVVSVALIVRGQRSAPPVRPPSVAVLPSSNGGVTSARPTTASATTPTTRSGAPVSVTGPAGGSGSVTSLMRGSWKQLLAGPLSPREGSATVWTGTELLIWGGQSALPNDHAKNLNDGALYNPVSRTWRSTSAAPMSDAIIGTAVWAGSKLFVWALPAEGTDRRGVLALFDPAANSWQTIAALPVAKVVALQAVWTGTRLLVLSWDDTTTVHLTELDVSSATWHALPSLQLPTHHQVIQAYAAAGNGSVYLLAGWAWTRATGPNSTETRDGVDTYNYRLATQQWAGWPTSAPLTAWAAPIWVGDAIAMPAVSQFCGGGSCPMEAYPLPDSTIGVPGGLLATTPRTSMTDPYDPYVWTGRALVGVGRSSIEINGHRPGGPIKATDPHTFRWQTLPSSDIYGSAAAWIGEGLLVWGTASSGSQTTKRTAFAELIPAG